MQYIQRYPSNALFIFALPLLMALPCVAEQKIIQQEAMSFDTCLQVIETSENKLSIAPELTEVSDQKRVAIFELGDGTLTITCSGVEGNVTVSTNTN